MKKLFWLLAINLLPCLLLEASFEEVQESSFNKNADCSDCTNPEKGRRGRRGRRGPLGPAGLTGVTGPTGITGSQGPFGPTGPTGLSGQVGPIGLTGATGASGIDNFIPDLTNVFTVQLFVVFPGPVTNIEFVPFLSYPNGKVDALPGYNNYLSVTVPIMANPTVTGTYHAGYTFYARSGTFTANSTGYIYYVITHTLVGKQTIYSIRKPFTIPAGSQSLVISIPYTYDVPFL